MAFNLNETVAKSKSGVDALLIGLEEIRRQVIVGKEALHRVHSQPVDRKTASARLDAWIENEGASEAVKAFARRFTSCNYREPAKADASAVVFVAVAASIRDAVLRQIDSGPDVGLSEKARADAVAKHQNAIQRLELAEEALIRDAERSGFDILRRPEADVRAVLAHDEEFSEWL